MPGKHIEDDMTKLILLKLSIILIFREKCLLIYPIQLTLWQSRFAACVTNNKALKISDF